MEGRIVHGDDSLRETSANILIVICGVLKALTPFFHFVRGGSGGRVVISFPIFTNVQNYRGEVCNGRSWEMDPRTAEDQESLTRVR